MISVQGVSKTFGERKVIDNLSLEIGKEVFAYLGPNGAGKTTLVNIICGLLKRDGGELTVCDIDPLRHPEGVRKRIGLVTQETALYDYLTARENLEFHANFYGVPRKDRKRKVEEALELSQLVERQHDRVGTFSGGMKRRLALVRSLLHDPDIIILDEPTLGIDVQNRNEIWGRILSLRGDKTVWINTNYMDEADRLADRCAVIDQGQIVALDSPEQLKIKHAKGIQLQAKMQMGDESVGAIQEALEKLSPKVTLEKQPEGHYCIEMAAKKEASLLLAEVAQSVQSFFDVHLLDLNVRVPTLDDVFLELTGKKLRD